MARLTFLIPEELKRRFKLACVTDGEEMSQRAILLLERWLEERDKQPKGKRR